MAGIDGGVGGEVRGEGVERVDHLLVTATLEVGAADAHAEEGVTAEGCLLLGAVEHDAARGVAGGVEDAERVGAEGDGVGVGEVAAYGGHVDVDPDTEDLGGLLLHLVHQELVVGVDFGLQAELAVDVAVAHTMVEVAVGADEVARGELRLADVADDGLALLGIEGAAVDDDALAGVVADDVAVLGEHIAVETLDSHSALLQG